MKKTYPLVSLSTLFSLVTIAPLSICAAGYAQDISPNHPSQLLPNSPSATLSASAAQPAEEPSIGAQSSSAPQSSTDEKKAVANTPQAAAQVDHTPKRIFGIIPNFRSVSTDVKLPPQTVKDKFSDVTKDSFDYSALFLTVAVASYSYGRDSTPEFGSGGVGYGRYLWHSAADQTIENYFVEFIVPVIAHEDTRFYILEKGGFAKRAGYSLARVAVTRSDSGKTVFNAGEIVGAAASSVISNYYYPRPERNFSNFASKYATNIGIDAASYFVKEFYPEISRTFSRRKQTPAQQTSAP